MLSFRGIKNSFWRVPLISLITGLLYGPIFSTVVIGFGVVGLDLPDNLEYPLTSVLILIAALILGWALLREQTRTEIFVSSLIVVVYGLLLQSAPPQLIVSPLSIPLRWTYLPTEIGAYLDYYDIITIPYISNLKFFMPWLFLIFGQKNPEKLSEFPEL